ncbi:MAG: type II CAAX prenyl endopeptidase Rce1 family protein, partial [Acidimicrobiia bacterium]
MVTATSMRAWVCLVVITGICQLICVKEVVDGGVIALLIIAIGPVVSFFADDPEPIRIGIVGTEPVGIEEGLTARAVLSEQEVEITRYDSLAAAEADLKKGTVDALLVDRYSALVAGIITGAAWWLWHYPPSLIGTGTPLDTPFWLFGIWVVAATVLMTSVFNASRGSVGLMMLFHLTANAS